MEFIKNLFKDDEKIVGLCSFRKKEQKVIIPDFRGLKLVYNTNTSKNFLIN